MILPATKYKTFSHFDKEAHEASRIVGLWNPRPTHRKEVRCDSAIQERICGLYSEGYTLRDLADWFLASHETIRTIVKAAGIQRRHSGTWRPELGTESIQNGYAFVYVGIGFLGANRKGWIAKHRLVMQQKLGRELMRWEVVHHIDRNKLNNRESNLKVLSRSRHPTCLHCPYYEYYVRETGNRTFVA